MLKIQHMGCISSAQMSCSATYVSSIGCLRHCAVLTTHIDLESPAMQVNMADQQPWVAAGCPQEVYSSLASAFNAEQALALCKTIASTALANRKLLQADPPAYAAETDLDALTDTVQGISDGLNAAWLVLTGALVFLMHGGFAMVSLGAELA